MRKLLTIILSLFLLFSSTLSVNTIKADELEDETEITEVISENEPEVTDEENPPQEDPEITIEEPEIELNNDGGFTSIVQDATTGQITAYFSDTTGDFGSLSVQYGDDFYEVYPAGSIFEGYTFALDYSCIYIDFGFIEHIGATAGETIELSLVVYDEEALGGYYFLDGNLTLTKGALAYPNDVTVSEDDDGNLVIQSADTFYINALAKADSYDSNGVMHYGSELKLKMTSPLISKTFGNVAYYDEWGEEEERFEDIAVSDDGECCIIYNSTLIESGVFSNKENQDYSYELRVFGYSHKTGTVHITKGLKTVEDYEVSIDSDCNVIISSSDEDWLITLCEDPGRIVLYRDESEVVTLHNNYYSFEEAEGENDAYIIIPSAVFRGFKLEDGEYYLFFSGAYGYADEEMSGTFELEGFRQAVPDDIEVYQDEQTLNIIITSSDADYLRAVCENNEAYKYYNHSGILIYNDNEDRYWYNCYENNEQITNLVYNEEESEAWIEIANSVFADYFSVSGETGITLYAPGYEDYDASFDYTANVKPFPTGLSITVDAGNNVIISGFTEEFISDWQTNASYVEVFYNGERKNNIDAFYLDLNEETRKLTITAKTMELALFGGFSYGQYTFKFHVLGYEKGVLNLNYKDTRKAVPKDLKVTQDSSGNLKITTSDSKYLKALAKSFGSEENYYSYIENITSFDIYNEHHTYNGETHYETNLVLKGNTITISNNVLRSFGWINGINEIEIYAEGYKSKKFTLTMTKLCVDGKPDDEDFTCTFVAGTGIVITCEDEDYLTALTAAQDDEGYGSFIKFRNVEEDHTFKIRNFKSSQNPNTQYYEYSLVNGQIVIPEIVLGDYGAYGTYSIELHPWGYTYESGQVLSVTVPSFYKAVPEDVVIIKNAKGDIVISSQDSDYLNAVMKLWDYTSTTAGGYVGGNIWINGNWYYNSNHPEDTYNDLRMENGSIVIDWQIIRNDINTDGRYEITLLAAEYMRYLGSVLMDFITTEDNLDDVHVGDTIKLAYDNSGANWYVSDEDAATITENGELTVFKQGTIEVNANDGYSGDTIAIEIKPYEPNGVMTAEAVYADNLGFIPGDEALIRVYDNGEECDSRMFEYRSKSPKIVRVTDNGTLMAVSKGTAQIDVYYKGTSVKVTSVKMTVIPVQVNSITLTANNHSLTDDVIYLSKDVKTIELTSECRDKNDNLLNKPAIKYTSSDTSIASVDAKGKVTIKKAGQFTITVSTTGNDKSIGQKSASIIFKVLDYTPTLESDKVSINRYYTGGTNIKVYAKYANDVHHSSTITGAYINTGSPFTASYSNGLINIKYTGSDTKNKTYNETLYVTVETSDSETFTYSYKLKLTTVTKLPTVKYTTSGTYNTFTNENTLKFAMEIEEGVTMNGVNIPYGWLEADQQGNVRLNTYDEKGNIVSKGFVQLYFEGYTEPVTSILSFKTESTAPKYKLDTSSVSLYVPQNTEDTNRDFIIHLKDGNSIITEGEWTLDNAPENTTIVMDEDGNITLHIGNIAKSHTLKLNYRKASWAANKKLSFSIKVNVVSALPTAKLTKSSLTLNTHFARGNMTDIVSSCTSYPITSIESVFVPSKNQADPGIQIQLVDGKVQAGISSGNVLPGSYKYLISPKITVGQTTVALKPVTLSVKVENTLPKLTLKKTSFKFNVSIRSGYEMLFSGYSIKNNTYNKNLEGVNLYYYDKTTKQWVDVESAENMPFICNCILIDDQLMFVAALKDSTDTSKFGKYEMAIEPVYEDAEEDHIVGERVKVSFTLYGSTPRVSATLKGTLNQLDVSQVVTGTLKFTGLDSQTYKTIKRVEVADTPTTDIQENRLFAATVSQDGKLNIRLINSNLAMLVTDGTYTLMIGIQTEGKIAIPLVVSVKVQRKAPTVKPAKTSFNIYDISNAGTEVARTAFTNLSVGTEILGAYTESEAFEVDIVNKELVVKLNDASKLKTGGTTKLTVLIFYMGDYGLHSNNIKNLRCSKVTLSLKDCSGSVKGVIIPE